MDTANPSDASAIPADVSDADLYAAAEAADAGRPFAPASPSAPEATPDTPPAAGEDANRKPESADERAAREEAELAEAAAAADEAEQQAARDQHAQAPKPPTAADKAAKEAERKERTWKQLNEEKQRIAAERAEIQRQRAEIEQLRQQRAAAPAAPATDEHGLEAKDYDRLAQKYRDQGNDSMAKLAAETAETLRAKDRAAAPAPAAKPSAPDVSSPEFQQAWRANIAALVQAEPELAKPDNPIVQTANALLQDATWSPYFLARPDGIRAAVEVAKLQTQAARAATLQQELAKQQAEVARLTRLVSPRGGLPGSSAPSTKPPSELSDAELYELARQADQGG